MKSIVTLVVFTTILSSAYAQGNELTTGADIEKHLAKGDNQAYLITMKKGEYAELTVMQKGVDIAIDLNDPSGKMIKTFDSPNGINGPEPVAIPALQNGKYTLHIYPLINESGMSDSDKIAWAEQNQGNYVITGFKKLSVNEYKQKLAEEKQGKVDFQNWITANAHEIKTVDAENGFDDLQFLKPVLKDVQVVGLGEASHGTSEFFRMKHRMLEFLVKEMGYTSFYIEASMARCRYINNYVLYGKGNLDTATAIQGFTTWRVEEVRNMIEWMRQYNADMPEDKKVKFLGYDLQINDNSWKELKEFYSKVNSDSARHIDSLQLLEDSAMYMAEAKNNTKLLQDIYVSCLALMNDVVLNQGEYQMIAGKEMYDENLMNIKLIVQEIKSYKDGYNGLRDYYMAQNIMYLLGNGKPGAKVVVWAHNGHIAKDEGRMGSFLAKALKNKYYATGFEFYSGSFQTRNLDTNTHSPDWDIMSVGAPPVESLPWYFNNAGKEKFFIDFRYTGTDSLKNFSMRYNAHSFGSMYSAKERQTFPSSLNVFDGMIFIRQSTAAKKFTKVYL